MMMTILPLLLQIAALVCLVCAAIGIPSRIGLGWLGLALWLLSLMVGYVPLHEAH